MTTDPSGPTRRAVLRQLALAITAAGAGVFNVDAARVVHALAGEARAQPGGYTPRALSSHQYATVVRLAELIVPADAGGGSAVDAGAPEFIDLLCGQNDELAAIYRDGVAWLDAAMRRRHDRRFVEAAPDEQSDLLDLLVVAERGRPERDLRAGVRFFAWIRRMTVDAYYTSPIGIADLGYRGNRVLSAYETPPEAVTFVGRAATDLGL